MVFTWHAAKTVIITMLVKQLHLSDNVGLNIENHGTDFATLKIMITLPYLDVINIMRLSLLASLI